MGGRTATILIAGSACAALLVLVWSSLAALSLADATPYWLGSLGIVCALGAAFLIFKDLVLWPVRFLAPRLSRFGEMIRSWVSTFVSQPDETDRAEVTPPGTRPAPTRRRH